MCLVCFSPPNFGKEIATCDCLDDLIVPARRSLKLAAAPLLSTQKSWTWLQIKHMISSSLQRRLVTHPLGGMPLLLHQLYNAYVDAPGERGWGGGGY